MSIIEHIRYVGANPGNVGGKRTAGDIRYLVYHYTANDGDTAINNAKYYRDNVVEASAHYFVDDNEVVQSVGDLTTAWAVGGKRWSDCGKTGGGKLYGVVTNSNSLSIEMCDTLRNGELMATEATLVNAAALGRLLMARYAIPIDHVVRHFDVTGKHCPAYYMDNARWAEFKGRLDEKDMERFQTIEEIERSAPWAVDTVNKLMERGALKGDGAGLDLSRDMLRILVVHDRMGLYGKEAAHDT